MADRLDDESLKALLSDEIHSSVLYTSSELSDKRTRALEYYRGEMTDTPAAANRSSVVSRDVADTIGWMLPGIIRVYTASDRMAEYEPVGRGDEQFASQATDFCNHIFWKDNPGYRILWDATHDSLLQGNGVVKHWWDDKEECEYSEHSGLTEEQIAILQQEQGVEIVAQSEGEPQQVIVAGPDGQPMPQDVPTYDVKLKRVTMNGRVRIECIEPENFLLDKEATRIEDARFCAHRDPHVTRSDLIEMGFSKDVVDNLPAFTRSGLLQETTARNEDYDGIGYKGHESMEPIELYECYVRVDVDGDGKAETVRAYYAGQSGAGELLDWEVWDDDLPFSDIPCEPVPHRWDARSVADETTDIQRVKTVLTRQLLDNLYWVNNPLMVAQDKSITNPEMLRSPVFGGTIFVSDKTTVPPQPLAVPFIGDKALLGLEHFDQVTEKRTGVSRSTMALDPEALTNQTATANQNQKDAAYSQIELIARNQAELGWKRVFKMILRLVVKHQDRPRTIRLRDEWVDMDPRHWNAAMDCTINVGLGTGSRDRDMQMLNNILQTQTALTIQMAQGGFADKAIQMIPKIVKTAVKLAESAGIKNPDEYYPDIAEEDVQQMIQQASAPKPNPELELEKAKIELQAQLEREKAAAAVQKEQAQMEADLQVKMAELQATSAAEQQKQQFEAAKFDAEKQFEREKLAEEARQKELDRRQQMQIEMMKLQAQQAAAERERELKREQGFLNADVKMKTAKQPAKSDK